MRLGAVLWCIHLVASISLCPFQNLVPPLSFPATPVLVSAPRKHAAVAVPLTATSSLLPKNISRCWKVSKGALSQSKKNTLFTFGRGSSVRVCSGTVAQTFLSSRLLSAQAGKRCSEETHTTPLLDFYSPLVVVLVGFNKEEWITSCSVLLPFHDRDLSSPRL